MSPLEVSLSDLRPDAAPVPLAEIVTAEGTLTARNHDLPAVIGASMDSDDIAAQELFIAVPGSQSHGAMFAEAAITRGAVAIATDAAGADILAIHPVGEAVPIIVIDNIRERAAWLAARIYGNPARDLITTAVTGTNGKTTTSYYIQAILDSSCGPAGLLGTIELKLPGLDIPSPRTTLEAPVLHRLLAVARERGVASMSLEASSHGLELHRFSALTANVAGFTNLQHDHLDFHHSMEAYLGAKAKLFTPERAKQGVVCIDDDWGRRLGAASGIPVQTLQTYGQENQGADWRVQEWQTGQGDSATRFRLTGPAGEDAWIENPLPGQVNVSNAALAVVMCTLAGVDFGQAAASVATMGEVPGRMQRVLSRTKISPLGYVDHAHTPESLDLALAMVRPLTPGRLIVVIGAGGDRDPHKRPLLGAVSARQADVVIVTDDNPRTEDPFTIREAVWEGAIGAAGPDVRVDNIADRSEAIAHAVKLAKPEDTIVLAGKGHETYQEIHGVKYPLSDVETLQRFASERWSTQ